MSFYVCDRENKQPTSLAHAVELAADGGIAAAVGKWHQHQHAANMCCCGKSDFDAVSCGFCFVGKLMFLELKFGAAAHGVDYLKTARAVSAFVGEKSTARTQVAEFYQLKE